MINQINYKLFLNWYAIPKKSRKPETIDLFCEKYNITKAEIVEYQDHPTYHDDLYQATMNFHKSKTPEMLAILYERYKAKQDPKDLKLWKELTFPEKEKDPGSSNTYNINLFNPTDEQRQQIIERISRRKSLPGTDG